MPRIIKVEQHAVFATLQDGSKFRVSEWMDWTEAIDTWTAMDDQRRDALKVKGIIGIDRFPGHIERIKHYEVRSENDPAYGNLPEMNLPQYFRVLTREHATDTDAAKAVLKSLGYQGNPGGWINYPDSAEFVAQGWWSAARKTGHPTFQIDGEKGHRAVVTSALQVKVQVG